MSLRALRFRARGSTLIVTIITLTVISMLAVVTLTRVTPRLRMAYQIAAWQEARIGAEAGVDAAMGEILRHAANPAASTWPGWSQQGAGGQLVPATSSTLGGLGNVVGNLLSLLLGGGSSPPASTGFVSSPPIFLDNLNVSASSGVPTEVDVQLWALHRSSRPNTSWFRIRSMATCSLPPTAYAAPEALDGPLRRFSLRTMRPQLRQNSIGRPVSVPLPNVSRTVEVLVEPILPFELALWTEDPPVLGQTGSWGIDSYDSGDPKKSGPNGIYPGRGSDMVQANGHLACNRARPADSPYGPLVDAGGVRVMGVVATNGGDDPATVQHENVTGDVALDPSRVQSDFCREMNPIPRPVSGTVLAAPRSARYHAGPEATPAIYVITGNLGDFRIVAPPGGVNGALVLFVDGDVNLTKPLIVPPAVTVALFVRGDVTFGDYVNAGPYSSNRAAQFLIFCESNPSLHHSLQAHGASTVCAAVYAPTCLVTLDGTVDWCGSVVAGGFGVTGGGDGGLHYDEALAPVGPTISYRIARYIEDVRE